MINFTKKIPFLFVFILLFSINCSVCIESKNQGQAYQAKKNLQTSKGLATAPDYGKLPLYFIPNQGQVDNKALFYAKASTYTLWLTNNGLIFDSTRRIKKESTKSMRPCPRDLISPEDNKYDRDVSSLFFINTERSPQVIPVDEIEHKVNYFIGKNKSKWRINIPTSRGVLYKELYRNIDLKVYGTEGQIEYDFIVKPGGEVSDISFAYNHIEKTKIDKKGNLVIKAKIGMLEHAKPVCYQIIEKKRIEVEADFIEIEKNTYGFNVKDYNKDYPLVLVYSTFLGGGSRDISYGLAVDSEGAVYVTGYTLSSDFPVEDPFHDSYFGNSDVFITKLAANGRELIFSTYLGGTNWDRGWDIAVDSEGAVYLTGYTGSMDFPLLDPFQNTLEGPVDVFIAKLDSSGTKLIFSTYIGGSSLDYGQSIAVDSEGAAYLTGYTDSSDFPVKNPIQNKHAGWDDVFITKVDSTGNAIIYSTFLGGTCWEEGWAIAVDSEGAAYVTGFTYSPNFPVRNPIQEYYTGSRDVFITKIDSSGSSLAYSTYLGGNSGEGGKGIAVDSEGAAYVTGWTHSVDFPTLNPVQENYSGWDDAFVTKIDSSGSSLAYSSYLGGTQSDNGQAIAVASNGVAYVAGFTLSADFPTLNPLQESPAGWVDVFLIKLNSAGYAFDYSTFFGGGSKEEPWDIAVDTYGAVYITGWTQSVDFPIRNSVQQSYAGGDDAFITKICLTYSLTISTSRGGSTDPKPGKDDFYDGCKIMIKAIPDKGYSFSHWSGDVSGKTNPLTVTMDSDKSIKANFVKQRILTIESTEGGTTDPPPGIFTYNEGTEVTITAIPDNSYRFSLWSGDISSAASSHGIYSNNPETKIVKIAMSETRLRFTEIRDSVSSTDNPIIITMDSDKSIKANFIKQHTLTLTASAGGTTDPLPGIYTYDEGTKVTFTAVPDTHFSFSHWDGDVSGTDNPKTVTINSDMFLTAYFMRLIYPPQNVTGEKVLNRSLSQAEYINVLNWAANPNNVDIVKYRIYQINGENRSVLIELNASIFQYWHRRVEKDEQYSYLICSVDSEDREGSPAQVSIQ
jgi:predicted ester cyclase